MEFNHRHYQPGETIVAISTPPGEGGISIIRMSGDRAIEYASALFSGNVASFRSHTAHFGIILDGERRRLDEGLVLLMRRPASYTGEDTVEFQCHGGLIASKKILEACLKAGARAAMPGEFTFKAFMNGKIDLAQAEAVQKVIGAKNEQAFAYAGLHLEGVLSKKIMAFQKKLIHWTAICEAWVDFPEEGLEFASEQEIIAGLHTILIDLHTLLKTFEEGKKIDQGLSLCIAGPPNAGKSSLMNALLNHERAIVTPVAGTTRDVLHEELTLGGLHFKLTDTAGIRETEEIIEQEGIKRSFMAIEKADVILLVLDGTVPLAEQNSFFDVLPSDKTLLLWNKSDHPHFAPRSTPFLQAISISAKERRGLDELKQIISDKIWKEGAPAKDEVLIASIRHKEALEEAIISLQQALEGFTQKISPEFLTADLRQSLEALGRIIGTNVTEEILTSIFSQFCIGK